MDASSNTTVDPTEKYVAVFDAKVGFTLNSIDIKVNAVTWLPVPSTMIVELRDKNGAFMDSFQPTNLPPGNGAGYEIVTIPLDFDIPAGTDYSLRLLNVYQDRVYIQTGSADYSVGGPLDNLIFHIKSYGQARGWVGGPVQADYYGGLFDWNVDAAGLKQSFYNTRAMVIAEDTCNIICGEDIDLNTWSIGGDATNGRWDVSPDGKSVTQNINGRPTFFISPEDFINVELTGSFTVNDDWDNDFAGFVFGYQAPLTDMVTQKYYLFDWKKENQGNGVEGFTLNEVDMVRDMSTINHTRNATDYWDHIDQPGFTILEKYQGPNTGWVRNQKYKFTLNYTSTRVVVVMDGGVYSNDTIIDRDGCFEPGRFGFYNFSQEDVTYADFSYKLIADYQVVYPEVCVIDSGSFVAFDSLGGSCSNGGLDLATNVVKWDWNFGDGSTGSGSSIKHKYTSNGYYDVYLQVTDSIGCKANVTKRIKVLIRQDVFLDATPDTLCVGSSREITATSILGSYYEWFRNGASLGAPSINDSSYNVTQTGEYYAQISGNPEYCDSYTDSVYYLFQPIPTLSLVGNSSCPNADSMIFTAPYLPSMVYDWTVTGANSYRTDSNVVTYYVGSSDVDFSLRITDTVGCESLPVSARVTLSPAVIISITPDSDVCEGDTVEYSIPDDGGTYSWNVYNAIESTPSNTRIEVVHGNQPVDLAVLKAGGTGCPTRDSIRVGVNLLPEPVISGPDTICSDQQGVFTSMSTGTLTWDVVGANSVNSALSTTISNFSGTTVTINLSEVDNNLCVGDTFKGVYITPLPIPVLNVPNNVCSGELFKTDLTIPYTTVVWNVVGASSFVDFTDSLIIETDVTNVDVSVSVIDSNGCEAITQESVIVNTLPNTEIDNPVTQVCDGNIFRYSPIITSGSNYDWRVNTSSFTAVGDNIDVTFDGSSLVWIYLEEVDVNNCEGIDSVLVTKQTIPKPVISGEINPCENTQESYNVIGSGGVMSWDLLLGDVDTVTIGTSFELSYKAFESVQISVLENLNGCKASDTFDIEVRKIPLVDLTAPDSVCIDMGYDISLFDEGGVLSWLTSGGVLSGTSVSPSNTAVKIVVTETSQYNCIGIDSVITTKNPLPTPVIDNPNLLLCYQSNEVYRVTPAVGSSYAWEVKNESFIDSGDNVNVTNVGGDFWVIVNEIDEHGCEASDSVEVEIIKQNPIVISGKKDVCIDEMSSYQATNNGGVMVWANASGNSVITDNLDYSIDVDFSVVNTVVLRAEETLNGCVLSDEYEVEVHAKPIIDVSTDKTVCLKDGLIPIVASEVTGVLSGLGVQGNLFNPLTSGLLIGQDNWLYFQYSDMFGCSNIDSTSIIVYKEPEPLIDLLDNVICEGDVTSVFETSITVGNKRWIQNSVAKNAIDTFVVVSDQGTYQLSVEHNGCTGKSNIVNVRTENAGVLLEEDLIVKRYKELYLTANYTSDVQSIQWFDSLGNLIGEKFDLYVQATESGCLEAVVKTSISCEATDQLCYKVIDPIIPMEVFSPNGDDKNPVWVVENILDYPRSVVKVFNRYGNIIFQETGYQNDWDGTRNGEPVPQAVYYYVIDLMDGEEVVGGAVTIIY